MKLAPLLLTASLAGNLVLAVIFFRRPTPSHIAEISSATTAVPTDASRVKKAGVDLEAALESGDVAALQAAGLSAAAARDLVLGRSMRLAVDRLQAARGNRTSDARWWRSPLAGPVGFEESRKARRELGDALAAAFGYDPFTPDLPGGADFLPADKRAALRRINQDYDDIFATFSTRGIQLPSDRERLALIRAERERDLAALLTPDELATYELHTSPSAFTVRSLYGDAIQSEDDFRTVFALQKAFDEKFPREAFTGRLSPEVMRARSEAEQQMQADLRAALGDDKYAALRRASDPDLRTVNELATRLNLPPNTTDRVAAARDTYAAESQRINADPSLSHEDRRAQIQSLAQRAKTEITQALGNEAADAYQQRSSWLQLLQNGMAYSTSPDAVQGSFAPFGRPGVQPVPPGGMPAPGTRQVVSFGATSVSAPAFAVPIGGYVNPVDHMQVATFTTAAPVTISNVPTDPTAGSLTIPGRKAPVPPPETTPPKQ